MMLSLIEQAVFREISLHQGRESAISVPTLTRLVNLYLDGETLSEVQVRQIVRNLIMDQGIPIGSSTQPPPGYYIITDPGEIEQASKSLEKRGLKILSRAAKIKNIGLKQFIGQLELKL